MQILFLVIVPYQYLNYIFNKFKLKLLKQNINNILISQHFEFKFMPIIKKISTSSKLKLKCFFFISSIVLKVLEQILTKNAQTDSYCHELAKCLWINEKALFDESNTNKC